MLSAVITVGGVRAICPQTRGAGHVSVLRWASRSPEAPCRGPGVRALPCQGPEQPHECFEPGPLLMQSWLRPAVPPWGSVGAPGRTILSAFIFVCLTDRDNVAISSAQGIRRFNERLKKLSTSGPREDAAEP